MLREVMVRYHQHPSALLWPAARGVTLPLLPRDFNYPAKWLSEPVSSVSLLSMLAIPHLAFFQGVSTTAGNPCTANAGRVWRANL